MEAPDGPKERIEYVRALDLPRVEIMRVDYSAPRRWRIFHETYTVCCLDRGRPADWVYRRRVHLLSRRETLENAGS